MQTKAIKQKIKSVRSIKKITKTMEMVSAAKMKKAVHQALTLRPFHDEAQTILSDIALDPRTKHPLLTHNKGIKELVIMVASHKGLCGSYNMNIFRTFVASYSKEERSSVRVITIGRFAEKIARRLGVEIIASFNHTMFVSRDARVVTKMLTKWYLEEEVSTVRLLYTHFSGPGNFTPVMKRLLPFTSDGQPDVTGETRFDYEPSIEDVLSHIVPLMVENIILSAVSESYASEHSARMFAMKNATDNAKGLERDLTLSYNRARQDAVTQEIAEITSGAMGAGVTF